MVNIDLKPGKYVVAVSGGVDSMALLHLLVQMQQQDKRHETKDMSKKRKTDISTSQVSRLKSHDFIVAHFDHGIRSDSVTDSNIVAKIAKSYGLPFELGTGKLGPNTSEEVARNARYKYLRQIREKYNAKAIITAHHQDDVLETAIINMLRGTGRRGLSSLQSSKTLIRPLLEMPKKDLLAYAKKHRLAWREDTTNADTKYLRNYIRHRLLPKLSASDRQFFLKTIQQTATLNHQLHELIEKYVDHLADEDELDRPGMINLPHAAAKEIIAAWLRRHGMRDYDAKTLERLVVAVKTGQPGKTVDINKRLLMKIYKRKIALEPR